MFLRSEKIMQMMPMNNGLFVHIAYQFPEVLQITNQELDLIFLTSWGLRLCAPIVHVIHQDTDSSMLTNAELTQLGQLIRHLFQHKWDKLAAVLALEYDPIHNFSDDLHEEITEDIDVERERTPNLTETETKSLDLDRSEADGGSQVTSGTHSENRTRTDNLSEAINGSELNKIYGFNSLEDSPVGDSTKETTSTRLNTGTVGDARQGTESTTIQGGLTHTVDEDRDSQGEKRTTGTDTTVEGTDRSRVRELTRLGNIGNLTSQQLITQEIELWRWSLIQQVLNDVKDFLTLPVYE